MELILDRPKRVMISQPMNGKSIPEIEAARNRARLTVDRLGYEIIDTWFKKDFENPEYRTKLEEEEGVTNIPVNFLARAIEAMSKVDVVFFCRGWQNTRGCKIEQQIAEAYGLETIYE